MMNLIYIILFAIYLLPIQILSQIDNKFGLDPYRLPLDRINSFAEQGEQLVKKFQFENFGDSESRTIVKKIILENGFLLIEVIHQGYYIPTGWLNSSKIIFTYDVNNKLIEKILYDWESYYWTSEGRWTYTYDLNINMIEEVYQDMILANWENSWMSAFTYDVNNNMIEELYHVWDGSNWKIFWTNIYTYDINNNLIIELKQIRDDSTWVNRSKTTFTYDVNNNMIEELYQEWSGNTWTNYFKSTYIYNLNNYKIEGLFQDWNGSNWINHFNYTYTYDVNNNLIEFVQQKWENSNWVNDRRYSYSFNLNNYMIEAVYQAWWATIWINETRWVYTYDVNNNKIEELTQDWNGSGYWLNQDKSIYSYIPILTDVNDNTSETKTYCLSNNYPNPFNPTTKIKFTIPTVIANEVKQSQLVILKIYDIFGNEVITLVNEQKPTGTYESEFEGTNLPSGIYFYQLKAGSFVETKKMILLK
jgi:hypothetical protein